VTSTVISRKALVADDAAADEEGVAGVREAAKPSSISPRGAPPRPLEADLQRVGVLDRADVHADLAGGAGVAQFPQAVRAMLEPLPAVVGAERVAAGCHEVEAGVEFGAREVGIGAGGGDLGVEGARVEGSRAGGDQDLLAEHVAWAATARVAVEVMGLRGLQRRHAFHHLEAVGGHEKRLRRRVVAVVRATDPLDEALDVLGRAHLNHEVHIAPVDPEVERAGADDGAQRARDHRGLHPLALFARERAVVDADGQRVLVGEPEVVEEQLGLRAGVVEDERGAVAPDLGQHVGDGVAAAAAGPGRAGLGRHHADVGVGAGFRVQDLAGVGVAGQ
jgi:hypothetical protein